MLRSLIRPIARFSTSSVTTSINRNMSACPPGGSKLFVGNLAWSTDTDALSEAFSRYGQVVDAIVMQDRETGRSRGFGFVTFSNPGEAEAAIAGCDNMNLGGRDVRVNFATSQAGGPRAPGGGGGGYRGNGGGGGYGAGQGGYGGGQGGGYGGGQGGGYGAQGGQSGYGGGDGNGWRGPAQQGGQGGGGW